MNIRDKVRVLCKDRDGVTGIIVKILEDNTTYLVKLDHKIGGRETCVARGDELILIEKGYTTHHVSISTEKLKELINNNYHWNEHTPQAKLEIVTKFAYFEKDKDIWEFLKYMED